MAYSVAITVSPKLLAGPCRMLDGGGEVPPQIQTLVRSTGTRDAALSALLLVAPPGRAARRLSIARVLCDGADAVWFTGLPIPASAKVKVAGVAAGWAVLQAGVSWFDRRR